MRERVAQVAFSDDELERIKKLYTQKEPFVTVREIAKLLGRSRNSISQKIWRMQLEPRCLPIGKKAADEQSVPAAPIIDLQPIKLQSFDTGIETIKWVEPINHKTEPRKCEYPLWNSIKPTHIYCGKPIALKWLCSEHYELCFEKTKRVCEDVG